MTCSEIFDLSFLQTTLCQPCLHSELYHFSSPAVSYQSIFLQIWVRQVLAGHRHTPGKVSSVAEPS